MDLWKLAAVGGWASAAIVLVAAVRLAREVRALAHPDRGEGRTHGESSEVVMAKAGPRYPQDAGEWGAHLADEAALLVEHGFEEQATYLHAAAGQLLTAADRGRVV